MKSHIIIAFLAISLTFPFQVCSIKPGDQAYCKDNSLCPKPNTHITCKNDWKISSSCRKIAKLYEFSNQEKQLITNLHNEYRNIIALGNLKGYQSASRMATMEWDDELAEMAELNVKTCKFEHDKCHNLPKFKFSGQNIYTLNIFPEPQNIKEKVIKESVEKWWLEYKDADMSYIKKFTPPRKNIGHFTAMIIDRSDRLGCAAIQQNKPKMIQVILTCNYASNNLVNFPLYKIGKPTSDCKSGKNPQYPGLCGIQEKYDINTFSNLTDLYK